jgi:hypothetical protein
MGLRWKIALQKDKEKKDKFIMQQLKTAHFFLSFSFKFYCAKTGKLIILHHDNLYISFRFSCNCSWRKIVFGFHEI